MVSCHLRWPLGWKKLCLVTHLFYKNAAPFAKNQKKDRLSCDNAHENPAIPSCNVLSRDNALHVAMGRRIVMYQCPLGVDETPLLARLAPSDSTK
jgi:hypothetical protein